MTVVRALFIPAIPASRKAPCQPWKAVLIYFGFFVVLRSTQNVGGTKVLKSYLCPLLARNSPGSVKRNTIEFGPMVGKIYIHS